MSSSNMNWNHGNLPSLPSAYRLTGGSNATAPLPPNLMPRTRRIIVHPPQKPGTAAPPLPHARAYSPQSTALPNPAPFTPFTPLNQNSLLAPSPSRLLLPPRGLNARSLQQGGSTALSGQLPLSGFAQQALNRPPEPSPLLHSEASTAPPLGSALQPAALSSPLSSRQSPPKPLIPLRGKAQKVEPPDPHEVASLAFAFLPPEKADALAKNPSNKLLTPSPTQAAIFPSPRFLPTLKEATEKGPSQVNWARLYDQVTGQFVDLSPPSTGTSPSIKHPPFQALKEPLLNTAQPRASQEETALKPPQPSEAPPSLPAPAALDPPSIEPAPALTEAERAPVAPKPPKASSPAFAELPALNLPVDPARQSKEELEASSAATAKEEGSGTFSSQEASPLASEKELPLTQAQTGPALTLPSLPDTPSSRETQSPKPTASLSHSVAFSGSHPSPNSAAEASLLPSKQEPSERSLPAPKRVAASPTASNLPPLAEVEPTPVPSKPPKAGTAPFSQLPTLNLPVDPTLQPKQSLSVPSALTAKEERSETRSSKAASRLTSGEEPSLTQAQTGPALTLPSLPDTPSSRETQSPKPTASLSPLEAFTESKQPPSSAAETHLRPSKELPSESPLSPPKRDEASPAASSLTSLTEVGPASLPPKPRTAGAAPSTELPSLNPPTDPNHRPNKLLSASSSLTSNEEHSETGPSEEFSRPASEKEPSLTQAQTGPALTLPSLPDTLSPRKAQSPKPTASLSPFQALNGAQISEAKATQLLAEYIVEYHEWRLKPESAPPKLRSYQRLYQSPLSPHFQTIPALLSGEAPDSKEAVRDKIKKLESISTALIQGKRKKNLPEPKQKLYQKALKVLAEHRLICFTTASFPALFEEARRQIPLPERFHLFHAAEKTQPIPTLLMPSQPPEAEESSPTHRDPQQEKIENFQKIAEPSIALLKLLGLFNNDDYQVYNLEGASQVYVRPKDPPEETTPRKGENRKKAQGIEERLLQSVEILDPLIAQSGLEPTPPQRRYYHERQSGPFCQTACLNNYLGNRFFSPEIGEAFRLNNFNDVSHKPVEDESKPLVSSGRYQTTLGLNPRINKTNRKEIHHQLSWAAEKQAQAFNLPESDLQALKDLLDIDTWVYKNSGAEASNLTTEKPVQAVRNDLKSMIDFLEATPTDRILLTYIDKTSGPDAGHIVALRRSTQPGRWILLDGNMPPVELNLEAYITKLFDQSFEISIQAPKSTTRLNENTPPEAANLSPLLETYKPAESQTGYLPSILPEEKAAAILSNAAALLEQAEGAFQEVRGREPRADQGVSETIESPRLRWFDSRLKAHEAIVEGVLAELPKALDQTFGETTNQALLQLLHQSTHTWETQLPKGVTPPYHALAPHLNAWLHAAHEPSFPDFFKKTIHPSLTGHPDPCIFLNILYPLDLFPPQKEQGSSEPSPPLVEFEYLQKELPALLTNAESTLKTLHQAFTSDPKAAELPEKIKDAAVPLKQAGNLVALKGTLRNYLALTSSESFVKGLIHTIETAPKRSTSSTETELVRAHELLNHYFSLISAYYACKLFEDLPAKARPLNFPEQLRSKIIHQMRVLELNFFKPILEASHGPLTTLKTESFRHLTPIHSLPSNTP